MPGETISLRGWSDAPYRSPQFEIRPPVVVESVSPIWVSPYSGDWPLMIEIGDEVLLGPNADRFARDDGFLGGAVDMAQHWLRSRGPGRFEGQLLTWTAPDLEEGP